MRPRLMRGTALAVVLVVGAGVMPATAQQAPAAGAPDAVVTEEAAAADAGQRLSGDDLDELVAPVALYPDSLLTQVLVAATFPLEIVKADRFIADNAKLSDKERNDAAEKQDWDPSVQVLAGGFPTVVQKMAKDLDWTEQLGDAMLAQPDDVLDAVQRQRARAVAVGNLSTNAAQVVDQTGDTISIAPANPDVVYVPQYDATTAYTTPYTTPPTVSTTTTGYTGSDLLVTGAIAFGSALLINEIFNDDDDWDNYWHGPSHIDWDDAEIRPRPNIDVNGDVNIDRSRDRTVVTGGDRASLDRTRIGDRDIGRGGAWEPSATSRAEARDRIASRESARPGGASAAAARDKAAARAGSKGLSSRDVGAKLAERKPPPRATAKASAFTAPGAGIDATKSRKAVDRGDLSVNKSKAKQAVRDRPSGASRPKAGHAPTRNAGPRSSAFSQQSGGHAKAAKARGARSSGAGGRGGRGGGGHGRRH